MKPNVRNPYGYQVCYKERSSRRYLRCFKTYTYRQAIQAKQYYLRYPPKGAKKPVWFVIPIRRSEVRAGIWREDPF